MLDALGVAVCLVDDREPDASLLYVNEAFERLTGWTADAALGRGLEAVLGTAAGEVERPGRAVLAIRRQDGSSLRCELTFTPVPAPAAGRLLGRRGRRGRRARAQRRRGRA